MTNKTKNTKPSLRFFIIKILIAFFISLAIFPSLTFAIKKNYNVQHIKLNLQFDEQIKSVSGIAAIKIIPLIDNFELLELHAMDMEIKSVKFENQLPLSFQTDGETVSIFFPQSFGVIDTLTIQITYFTIPTKGVYFNNPRKKSPQHSGQIYSHSEPEHARHWFPCYDKPDEKFTSEIIATVPENYFLLSNGELISTNHNWEKQTKTYHWSQTKPHNSYLVSITAGEYFEIKDFSNRIPLYYYVYESQKDDAMNSFSDTPKMLSFFENIFGYIYPWNKYAQIVVDNYKAGGMEHTGATTLNDYTIHDRRAHLDRNSDDLVSHELAHQWFGNLITCRNWSHLWLNEGFATYAEILYKEYDMGKDEADYANYVDQQYYLDMMDKNFFQPIVYKNYVDPAEMFNYIAYQKAGQVLHMFHHTVGDSLFYESLKSFLHQHEFGAVETIDFQKTVERVCNQNFSRFFDLWLFHGGHPKFKIHSHWDSNNKQVYLFVRQVQEDSLGLVPKVFQMPVEVEIFGKNRNLSKTIFLKTRNDTFKFSFDSRPLNIRFDKENYLLKEMDFFKTEDEWIFQLLNDKNVAARLNAIVQLETETIDTLQTVEALEHCLLYDPFWAVREEVAYLLIDNNREATKDILKQACNDASASVRAAAVNALGNFYENKYNPLFRQIAKSDSSYKVIAAALYGLSHVEDEFSFDFLSEYIDVESDREVVASAAFQSIYYLKDKRSIPIAIRFARDTTESKYRRSTALSLLKEIGSDNTEVESVLIDLLNDPDQHIKKKAIEALGSFKTERSLFALKKLSGENLPGDIQRRLQISIEKISSNK